VVPTAHCPFDALTKDNKILIITGISKQDKRTAVKARIINDLSKITEQYSVIFLEKRLRTENLEGTPIIHKEELKNIDDSDDILTLIYERSNVK
jgi:putative transcriptional regulator